MNDEVLRPYFALSSVLDGLFGVIHRIFGVTVEAADGEAPIWHDDVRFFKVLDNGKPIVSVPEAALAPPPPPLPPPLPAPPSSGPQQRLPAPASPPPYPPPACDYQTCVIVPNTSCAADTILTLLMRHWALMFSLPRRCLP